MFATLILAGIAVHLVGIVLKLAARAADQEGLTFGTVADAVWVLGGAAMFVGLGGMVLSSTFG